MDVARFLPVVLVLAACSGKSPPPPEIETPRPPPGEVAGSGSAPSSDVANVPPPDPREAALSMAVLELLENEHLLRKPIDDTVSRAAFETYIDRLDPTKLFLLRSDRDALGRYADKIDDELRAGTLDLAHDGMKVFVRRVDEVSKIVAELLAKPFDHTDKEFLELDPKKLEPPATDADLRDRWRRRLELEVLERVAQMEDRLAAQAKAKAEAAKAKTKTNGKTKAKAGSGSATNDDEDDSDDIHMPLAKIPPTREGREAKARTDLAKMYAGRFARMRNPAPLDAASDVINAVTAVLDPHTDYLPPADKANFDIRMTGTLEGIGAVLRERDHYIEITSLVPGGASWRDGRLGVGDLILAVQQAGKSPVDTVDMRIDDVVKMIRGPKGTVVRLRVQKPTGVEKTIAITRDVVMIEEAYARGAVLKKPRQPAYGYIHLPSFYGGRAPGQRTAAGDIAKLLNDMKKRKLAGAIIDIRGNGGGLLGDAVDITGELIDKGPVVQVQDSRGKRRVHSDDTPGELFDKPVIVLVDRFSASASEILAGALQDYHRAVIVGTGAQTHGKGTVQKLADLDRMTGGRIELGVVKITIEQFFRVSGASTQLEGVKPDIQLPDPAAYIETGERTLDHAIAWSAIDPAPHVDWKPKWTLPLLVKRSASRVAKDPLLSKIGAATAVLEARRKDTRVPLEITAWEKRRKAQRDALDAASPDLKSAPARFKVTSIDDGTPPPPPRPDGKPDDRLQKWREGLARDPWVNECVDILDDMRLRK